MIELAVVLSRLVQYIGAAVLFGSPLFCLYGLASGGLAGTWQRRLALFGGVIVVVGSALALLAQTAMMAGSAADAFVPATLTMVATGTQFGLSLVVRLAAGLVAVIVVVTTRPSLPLWWAASGLGAVALGSFAWSGHGADGAGVIGAFKLLADIVHLLAAGLWLGALAALAALVFGARATTEAQLRQLHQALEGFSGVGSLVVALLVLTGLVNVWFLVGPSRFGSAASTVWGEALVAKIVVFGLMLSLAALNRFMLTPRLRRDMASGRTSSALAALQRSLALESAAGFTVLALVSWLGTLVPPAAL
ncbi:MAG: copper homeostasis membrane protein CopD [Gemmatimonadaceae bacterium]|nr:copper homeostasis membrane protein CopD [Caulobacter sp.]